MNIVSASVGVSSGVSLLVSSAVSLCSSSIETIIKNRQSLMIGSHLIIEDMELEILRVLGNGGFGRTYYAIDKKHDDRKVCVKQLFTNNEAQLRYIERESENLLKLEGLQGIPSLYAFKIIFDCPFLVMDYIVGADLREENDSLDESEIRDFLIQMCNILKNVHAQHIVHRDISPYNILRDEQNNYWLVDFGISSYIASNEFCETINAPRHPVFCSPEQRAYNTPVGMPSDIYSLGKTAFYLAMSKGDPIIEWMCQNNSSDRPTAEDVLQKLLQ